MKMWMALSSQQTQMSGDNHIYGMKKKFEDAKINKTIITSDTVLGNRKTFYNIFKKFLFYAVVTVCVVPSFLVSCAHGIVSSHNYPGGHALQILTSSLETRANEMINSENIAANYDNFHVKVYVDVASAMTGISLFGQRNFLERVCVIDEKRNSQTNRNIFGSSGDCLIAGNDAQKRSGCGVSCEFIKGGYEDSHNNISHHLVANDQSITHAISEKSQLEEFTIIGVAEGFPRLDLRNLSLVKRDAIYVFEREGW
eukprot:CAMPEP_0184864880 /NCGR_PEP_ID=MMETSP0580-20130426/16203_1 /TAXON_ID=1118495 /ORGANISM="Dactyliosolen fragilissimus" /LENGTH=254 /DNA_ID=CAMNT_0027363819 /DNA_START=1382 /DNA_END=2143 /DNA_ORIENTATION=-